jgi:excisionase family DNA binding protein
MAGSQPPARADQTWGSDGASDSAPPLPLALLAQLLAGEIPLALHQRVPQQPPLPRLALSPAEAARALGVSRDFFDQHLLPELRIVRRGRRRLIPLRELERWLEQAATRLLAEER